MSSGYGRSGWLTRRTGFAQVRTLFSGISRGTERLVLAGLVPTSEWQRMRAPLQAGEFPFPVKYGYCAVGVVEAGPDTLLGRSVFCLHPHQDRFIAPVGMLTPVPEDVPARRATLAANMETALNALWDAGAGPADRIVVIGGGVVGLLVGFLAARLPGAQVVLSDVDPSRASLAAELGIAFAQPGALPADADIVFHTSASEHGTGGSACLRGHRGEHHRNELVWRQGDPGGAGRRVSQPAAADRRLTGGYGVCLAATTLAVCATDGGSARPAA